MREAEPSLTDPRLGYVQCLGTWFFHDIPQILVPDERQKRGCPAVPSGVDVPENGQTDVKGSSPASVASMVLLSPCSHNLQILISL